MLKIDGRALWVNSGRSVKSYCSNLGERSLWLGPSGSSGDAEIWLTSRYIMLEVELTEFAARLAVIYARKSDLMEDIKDVAKH